nr:ATP synthase F0 subunit 6 [Alcedoecus sp.]
MICGLFSLFDPVSFSFSLKWATSIIVFVLFWQVFPLQSGINVYLNFMNEIFFKNFLINKSIYLVSLIIVPFKMILFYSLIGLLPYSFPLTSHLTFNLTLAIPLWMVGILSIHSLSKFISHLVPLGSPLMLSPFLVLVESVSLIIRPMTLAIRLMANVTAGHLILSIVTKSSIFFASSFQIMYSMFEFFIMFVQAFVFVNLLSLYWEE